MIKKLFNLTKRKILSCATEAVFLIEDRYNFKLYEPSSWAPTLSRQEGFKLADLIKLHLEDHGYKILMAEENGSIKGQPWKSNTIFVFNSRIKFLLKMRHNIIAFELGRPKKGDVNVVHNLVWTFNSVKKTHASHYNPKIFTTYYSSERNRILCDLNNPRSLDIILEEVKRYYGSN